MPNVISSITRAATRKVLEPLNVLTFPTHEAFETGLAKTEHNFYAYRDQTVKDWNYAYRKLPDNYTLFNPRKGPLQIPMDIDFDIVLSQNKFGQYEIAKRFSDILHLPLISLEHTLPHPTWTTSQLDNLYKMRGDVNVFISEMSRKAWGWREGEAEVVHHGIDTDCFAPLDALPREPHLLSVVNDWINRDWCCGFKFWRHATMDLPVHVLGATPGLSRPANTLDELVYSYRKAQIFVNTSLISPVPTALLEAMASGCCVVSAATCMIPEIVKHGVNGFLCNTPEEMRALLPGLLGNPELCESIGMQARKTIIDKFGLDAFVERWNQIFSHASAIVKHGANA